MKSPVSFLRLGLKNRSHRRKTKQNQAFMYNRALDLKADSYHRIFTIDMIGRIKKRNY